MHSLNRKTIRKTCTALLITGALAATGTVAVLSTTPAQAVDTCRLKVHMIRSLELQDNDDRDEIKFELGDNEYGIYTFPDNWSATTRSTIPTRTSSRRCRSLCGTRTAWCATRSTPTP